MKLEQYRNTARFFLLCGSATGSVMGAVIVAIVALIDRSPLAIVEIVTAVSIAAILLVLTAFRIPRQ